MSKSVRHDIQSVLLVALSSLLSATVLKGFVEPAKLLPSGFLGLSRLISQLTFLGFKIQFDYMILYLAFQITLTIIVFGMIGKRFAVLSILHYSLTTLLTYVIPSFHVSDDIILLAIFGGVLSGISGLLSLKGEASGGGTDFIAIYVQNKSNMPIWDYIMYSNWIILIIGGLFFGFEASLYSMLYQYVTTTLINNFNSRNRLMSLTIITSYGDEISDLLLVRVKHGVTISEGKGAYSKAPKQILYTVVNQFEVNEVVSQVRAIDKHAFINVSRTERIIGNFKKKQIT